jgi:Fe-S-cluster-containing hydrogenase component 2
MHRGTVKSACLQTWECNVNVATAKKFPVNGNPTATANAGAQVSIEKAAVLQSIPTHILPPVRVADYVCARQQAIFEGISNEELATIVVKGGISQQELERDLFVANQAAAGGIAAPIVMVTAGQIAAGVFGQSDLMQRAAFQERMTLASKEEIEEQSLLKPPPLARISQKNIALFTPGDLFNSNSVSASKGLPVAFYSNAPSQLLFIEQRAIADLVARHPAFEARVSRALASTKERMAWLFGVKQELLDFFVRQGISVAGEMVRVRQLDLCIDCKQCEDACEERYGAKRLTLGGYHLGMLDFVYTCRTCTDQRCIDPCEYDSIKFDPVRKEVIINEATCTGCTACAQSCPYGAIDMVEVDPGAPTYKEDFKLRLDENAALTFGPGTPRVAKARRIANKCDHCGSYGDQACISACPTGSLIEIDSALLFKERSVAMSIAAQTGFEFDPQKANKRDRGEVLPVMPFTDSLGVRNGGIAKVRRGRWVPLLLWSAGIVVLGLCLLEVMLRKYAPSMSYMYSQLRKLPDYVDLPEAAVLEKVLYRSGDELSVWTGVIGTGLMALAAIYPIFRRIRVFRWLASNTMWFDIHMMAGWLGPLFVMMHSAFKLDSWVSAAWWSMVIVLASGILGRYLYTQVPALSSGVELEQLDNERAFAAARLSHAVAMSEIDQELLERRSRAADIATSPSVIKAITFLIVDDLAKHQRNWSRAAVLSKLGVDRKKRKELVKRSASSIRIARSQVVAPKAQLLLHTWKKVHVPFTVLLTVFAAAHIYLSWARAW